MLTNQRKNPPYSDTVYDVVNERGIKIGYVEHIPGTNQFSAWATARKNGARGEHIETLAAAHEWVLENAPGVIGVEYKDEGNGITGIFYTFDY